MIRRSRRSGIAGEIEDRIALRLGGLLINTVVAVMFVAFGGLFWGWALAGVIGHATWIACWPRTVEAGSDRARAPRHSQSTDDTGDVRASDTPVWRAMLDGIRDAAFVLDARNHVLAKNAAARALFPIATGRHLVHVYRSPELLLAVEQAQGSGMPKTFEFDVNHPVERHFEGLVTPLQQNSVNVSGPALLLVLRDRTEAEQLAKMRADFVANASHELRTPLASLKGYVETLQGAAKDDPAARARFLPVMQAQADRMSRLIEALLSLSRIEMREHVPPRDAVDLAPVVAEAVEASLALAETAGIALVCVTEAKPALVIGDRDELLQVAHNLIQNAIKYGRPGGKVEVGVRRDGERFAVAVVDDGIGIAPEHLPRLTERFYRVSAKESRERGGTGLGLAIVKHIVNRHRGELQMSSTPGKGSTFTVFFPASAVGRNDYPATSSN